MSPLSLLKFRNIEFFPIVVWGLFYFPQSIAGIIKFNDEFAWTFVGICVVAVSTYFVAFRFVFSSRQFAKLVNGRRRIKVSFDQIAVVLLSVYAAIIIYAAATVPQVALFAAIGGARVDELAHLRESFVKSRTGGEIVLLYGYAIFTMTVVPYILVTLFGQRRRVRFVVLGGFLFTLLLTLEKSVAIIALLPLAILFSNRNKKSGTVKMLGILLLCIGSASLLSRGAISDTNSDVSDELATVPPQYSLFESDSIGAYLANRVAWIPYLTAYDWLRFRHEHLKDGFTYGASVGPFARLTGMEYIPLEREIFEFEFGQNESGTGQANTLFFIDGFLNFGILGTILYSAVFALIVKVFCVTDNIAAKAVAFVPLFYTTFNSLTAVLFSGGLGFMVILTMVCHPPPMQDVDQANAVGRGLE